MVNVKTFVATLKVLAQDIVAVVFFLPVKKVQSKKHQGINLSLVFFNDSVSPLLLRGQVSYGTGSILLPCKVTFYKGLTSLVW